MSDAWVVLHGEERFCGLFVDEATALQSISFSYHKLRVKVEKTKLGAGWKVVVSVFGGEESTPNFDYFVVRPEHIHESPEHL